jgi:hypothetical protein
VKYLSYANVLSTVALFIVLGGTSYAVTRLPSNSVGTAQLKAGAVTPGKLAKTIIPGLKGSPGSPGAVGPKGDAGQVGAQGSQGIAGLQGVAGPPGAAAGAVILAITPVSGLTLTNDAQWHTWVAVSFTATANTYYEPNSAFESNVYSCGFSQRTLINGVDPNPGPDGYMEALFGPYPAGTAVSYLTQVSSSCSQSMPAGRAWILAFPAG